MTICSITESSIEGKKDNKNHQMVSNDCVTVGQRQSSLERNLFSFSSGCQCVFDAWVKLFT